MAKAYTKKISMKSLIMTDKKRMTMSTKTVLATLALLLTMLNAAHGQGLTGRIYLGEDIMNQGKERSNVDATVRLEFVSETEARLTPSIKAKPEANFMMKFGLKMAQKKMAKAVAQKPLLKYSVSKNTITVVGGGQKGKGDAVYTILNDGQKLRCNDGEKTYVLKRIK